MCSSQQFCISLLRDCKTLKNVKQIHAFLCKAGLDTDHFVAGKLLLQCVDTVTEAIDYARQFLHNFSKPDGFMYNTLIRGLSELDSPRNSLIMYVEMRRKLAEPPESFSFAFVLKAAGNYRSLKAGLHLHCQAFTFGLSTHLFVGTTLVSMYAECGCVGYLRKVFEEITEPNVVAWNAIITACFRIGDVKDAEKMFDMMPFRNLTSWNAMLAGYTKAGELYLARKVFSEMSTKDAVSWNTMIVGFAQNGCFDEAFGFFRELRLVGIRPNEVSLTGVLSACAQAGAFEFGKILHGFIEKFGFVQVLSVNNALLDVYAKCGNLGMACLIFERMPEEKTIVSWTSMMAGLAMHGYGEQAIKLFHEMEESGIRPDGITFISILYACSHAGLIKQGCQYFSKMTEFYHIEPTIEHYGCVVDLYGRAGQLQKAYEFVIQMPISPTAIIWRTLLGACSIYGDVEMAEQVKKRISELDPNNSSDEVLLSNIYAISGKWKDVATVRRSMTDLKIKKAPGWSMIEVDKIMYSFVAGQGQDKISEEAHEKLKQIMLELKVEEGYIPEVRSVLHDIEEEEKEDVMSRHSEKLAVAFGISRLSEQKTIRIVKNLRICGDCHTIMKLISKVYGLELVVRDRSRFHTFKQGFCSCRDYW